MPPDTSDFTPSDYRILVVEDEQATLNFLQLVLRHAGYRVEVALDSRTGLEILERQTFDLAIVDTCVSGVNHFEMLQQLRSDPRWAAMPVIMYGEGGEIEKNMTTVFGADGYMHKPIFHTELVVQIRDFLLKGRGQAGSG